MLTSCSALGGGRSSRLSSAALRLAALGRETSGGIIQMVLAASDSPEVGSGLALSGKRKTHVVPDLSHLRPSCSLPPERPEQTPCSVRRECLVAFISLHRLLLEAFCRQD